MVGLDEGEGVNYLSNSSQIISGSSSFSGDPSSSSSSAPSGGDTTASASSGYDEWDNAISNLINANYKTDQARNYIQQFVWFEYRNWTNTPPNKQMYRNNALNVSYRKNRSTLKILKLKNQKYTRSRPAIRLFHLVIFFIVQQISVNIRYKLYAISDKY